VHVYPYGKPDRRELSEGLAPRPRHLIVTANTAVFLGDQKTEISLVSEELEDIIRKEALLLPLRYVGNELLLDELSLKSLSDNLGDISNVELRLIVS
jgi:hypothetical protein